MRGAYLQLAGAVLLNTASYLVYRGIAGLAPRAWWPLFLFGLLLGAANTYLFTRALEVIPLSIAFPVFSGACFVLVVLAGATAFHERVSPLNLVGVGIVLAGILLASR